MNKVIQREDVVDTLTIKDEKGCEAISEPTIVQQTIIVFLIELLLIAEMRIGSKSVDRVTFVRKIVGHGQRRK